MARDEAVGIGMAAWTVAASLLIKLVERGALARTDAEGLIDQILLEVEGACPPGHPDFATWTTARASLELLLDRIQKVPLEPFQPKPLGE